MLKMNTPSKSTYKPFGKREAARSSNPIFKMALNKNMKH